MKRPFEVSKEIYPFKSHWCTVNDIPIHYIDEGQGPVILFIHGNYMWSFSWRKVIDNLKTDFRCIAIDLPGMGMSGKPHELGMKDYRYTLKEQSEIVELVLEKLNLSNITFVAYDHGGPIGLGVAVRKPNLFSNIVITNTWAWLNSYMGTSVMSFLAPKVPRLVKCLTTKSKMVGFESPKELGKPGVWDACVAPYASITDFTPIVTLANQLTQAKEYYNGLEKSLETLKDKKLEIIWATEGKGLLAKIFAENIDEDKYLRKWRNAFPNANTQIMNKTPYWFLSNPPNEFIETVSRLAKS